VINKICSQCFNVFEARRSNAKFCSPACKQKAHRIKHGQNNTAFGSWADATKTRYACKHCHNGFYGSGKGRTPKFCSNSCRVSANRFKHAASFKFVKKMNGSSLGWSDYECFVHVQDSGTAAIETWANKTGWEYSYATRSFWSRKENKGLWS